jgi:hypothetical protein
VLPTMARLMEQGCVGAQGSYFEDD